MKFKWLINFKNTSCLIIEYLFAIPNCVTTECAIANIFSSIQINSPNCKITLDILPYRNETTKMQI